MEDEESGWEIYADEGVLFGFRIYVERLLEKYLYKVQGSIMRLVFLETTIIIPNFLSIRLNFLYSIFSWFPLCDASIIALVLYHIY